VYSLYSAVQQGKANGASFEKNQFTLEKNGPLKGFDFYNNKGVKPDGSHAGGLGYVPRDGYIAELHRGERVLTAGENRGYDAASVWQMANDKLGAGAGENGDIIIHNVSFAPVINGGSAAEIMPQLEQQQRSFMDEFQSLVRQQRRVSFSG
jgi:hypothetical protein